MPWFQGYQIQGEREDQKTRTPNAEGLVFPVYLIFHLILALCLLLEVFLFSQSKTLILIEQKPQKVDKSVLRREVLQATKTENLKYLKRY